MPSSKALIPLHKQPEYQAAIAKVVSIGRVLTETTTQLQRCKTARAEILTKMQSSPTAIDRAMALVGGSPLRDNPPPENGSAEIERLELECKALSEGLKEANLESEAIGVRLSREQAVDVKLRHRAHAKTILSHLQALNDALKEEAAFASALESNGYHWHGIPSMQARHIGLMDDSTGSPAYYFAKELRSYIDNK